VAGLPIILHARTALHDDPSETRPEDTVVVVEGERSIDRVVEEARLFVRRAVGVPPGRAAIDMVDPRETVLAGRRVLLVDDDMRNVYSLSNALQSARLSIVAAADGYEAIEQLDAHRDTALVLMDIMMPRMDGHEAIRRIREQERHRALPIIALTARAMPGDRQKCLDAGANDFIAKPVDVDRLLALLRVWLRDRPQRAGIVK
jgi:CheY-like chemotaxis protein